MKKSIVWAAAMLICGVLCALAGAAVASRTRRPPNAGLLDPADLIAMTALKAGHPDEFARLRTAETTHKTGRRLAPQHPGQNGDDRAR